MAFSPSTFAADRAPGAGVTAVLGPTNTGKTHLAIERMLGHSSGVIGLPLRLLAREVYNKIADRAGVDSVALVTGEEKIKPKNPRYWVSTVEAMPRDLDVSFLAVDEIQIAADLERGHVFTDRILHRRGRDETLLLGAATMRPIIERLLPGASIITRPRLSQLEFAGDRKITRQPRRTAIVAFSADEVYAIAELIRRQHGGAAVVLGSLSPRTRNAQVAMFQSGEVDWKKIFGAAGSRWFHTGGIFAALSETAPLVAKESMQAARDAGTIVSYDLNYRPSLWQAVGGQARAREVNRDLAPLVDVMIGNEEDFTAALGFEVEGMDEHHSKLDVDNFRRMIEHAVAEFPNLKVVATTLRHARTATRNDWGAVCYAEGQLYQAPPREDLEIYDRVGGGDSFASGLIYGFLTNKGAQYAVDCGAAHGALAMTMPGDTTMATLAEVEELMKGGTARVAR